MTQKQGEEGCWRKFATPKLAEAIMQSSDETRREVAENLKALL